MWPFPVCLLLSEVGHRMKKVGKAELKDIKNYIVAYLRLKEWLRSQLDKCEIEINVCIKGEAGKKQSDEVL
jgi:hypothetical protein